MKTIALSILLAVGTAAAGFVLGRATAPEAAVAERPPDRPQPKKTTTAAVGNVALGLVCAARGRDRSDDEIGTCESEALRAKWCEAQLDQCRGERRAVREPWPEDEASVESPGAWAEAVEGALTACDLGVSLELVECTEYPCVAALRPDDGDLDEAGRKAEMKRLMAQARACAPLREAFGIGGPEHDEAIDVYRLDARCAEGRESFFVLSALSPEGAAYARLTDDEMTEFEDRDMFRWMYRRADDVSALWPCERQPDRTTE